MSTLFMNNNAESGFRLRYVEIYNWGTFHGKVYKLTPDGKTSLLTGANGSGKTTLIDALLTLLVPSNKRFYNQSSGAESKKERDELSYFWGYHGKTYSEEDEASRTEQLRNKSDNPYSVLLSCFQNSATLHSITLVQVRWFSGGTLKKVYIVAPYKLTITDDFGKDKFDIRGEWRKKIKKLYPKIDLYDSFKEYSIRFSDLFGLKEKALSLFNQTVGIKVLGDLTQFVRQQMLEEPDSEEQFKNLYAHYTDLLLSHKAIQKDEKQLEFLHPIILNKSLLEKHDAELQKINSLSESFPLHTDKLEYALLEKKITSLEQKISIQKQKKENINESIQQNENARDQLISQKAALNIDHQIELLNKDLNNEIEKRDKKQENSNTYFKLTSRLGLPSSVTEDLFYENLANLEVKKNSIAEKLEKLTEQRFYYRSDNRNIQEQITDIQESINSYLNRKNRIPADLINVRAQLLVLLEASEDELPFAGELIKVKEEEHHWEDSIERVLNSFARQLFVPERYIKLTNHFVHTNNLGTRLIYQRIERKAGESYLRWPTENDLLVNKLDIKDNTAYKTWLENQLFDRYNYFCTDDLDIFYRSQKALTSNGLIRNIHRHEKDDRPKGWSKINYVLGWDNKETVRILMQEKEVLQEKHKTNNNHLQEIQPAIQAIDDQKIILTQLSIIESYEEINWDKHALRITNLLRQLEELKNSSDQYKAISSQLEEVEKKLREEKEDHDKRIIKITQLEDEHQRQFKRKQSIKLDCLTFEIEKEIEEFIQSELNDFEPPESLEALSDFKDKAQKYISKKENETNKIIVKIKEETIGQVVNFKNPSDLIQREFPDWSGDVINISQNLNSLDELEELFNKIKNQRLVEHKRRFQDYMDKSMLDALTSYRTWLTNEEERIKDLIDELNIPLRKITFNKNPDTYLQLEHRATKEQEIKIFKQQLSIAIPSALEFNVQTDDNYRETIFQRIKELITELQKEEVWRRKVTDIRNWLSFSAREYSVVDGKSGQYHENTASYSGGQKAQFTYAILGAAIAHQFGIFEEGKQHRSLRFITVDEAFSKLDPEKSQFLMEFCSQLNLQILVVTPFDKINIAEPYIYAVHFVEIKNKKHSIVYNLTMEEYYERKEEFNQLTNISE